MDVRLTDHARALIDRHDLDTGSVLKGLAVEWAHGAKRVTFALPTAAPSPLDGPPPRLTLPVLHFDAVRWSPDRATVLFDAQDP
jgi:hypothetical protein